jgi:hypothetical protein
MIDLRRDSGSKDRRVAARRDSVRTIAGDLNSQGLVAELQIGGIRPSDKNTPCHDKKGQLRNPRGHTAM